MASRKSYLGVPVNRMKAAFFELTSCEGCQLQLLNNEASLLDFLALLDIVQFREAMTERSDDYEVAFVEGSVTRPDEEAQLRKIRNQARLLVAFGSCACFGGVNRLKNRHDPGWTQRQVYGDHPTETSPARPLEEIVPVDLRIYGCPVRKEEVEKIVTNLAIGKDVHHPRYPVCMECKANENICLFDLGEPCLGPVTRAGCNSWCTNSRMGCWGCRGPSDQANIRQMHAILRQLGLSEERIMERFECFGGFARYTEALKTPKAGA